MASLIKIKKCFLAENTGSQAGKGGISNEVYYANKPVGIDYAGGNENVPFNGRRRGHMRTIQSTSIGMIFQALQ
jgi:hypothetical protein